jgi:transcriptional regulator with XRE-family HTH domain
MNDALAPLYRNLQRLRKEKSLSQAQAARALGVSQVLLSHYENGARKPNLEFLLRVCDFYKVTLDYLFGRSGLRDGSPAPEEETTPEDDKRLTGMASAKLGAALLTSSLKIIYDLLGRMGSAPLITDVTAFLGTAVARVFFRLTRNALRGEFFPDARFETASILDLLHGDLNVERSRHDAQTGLPDLTYQNLEAAYPQHFKALVMLSHQAGERVRKL